LSEEVPGDLHGKRGFFREGKIANNLEKKAKDRWIGGGERGN
jgi:hypothetical protein